MLLNEPTESGAKLALIDCGLMASIDENDRDNMISAVIHLANKDYASLVDDFIKLKILPPDSNRAAIIPLMDKALTPYVQGGGYQKYQSEIMKTYGMEEGSMSSQVGGVQAMTQDALTVLQDIPFSVPPYFAILGRAIVTLEGVALTGNPDYGIIMESYPFIARKLLREGRPEIQKALQEVLYSGADGESTSLKFTRLLALLNNAAGSVAKQDGAVFVDLDTIPEDGLSVEQGLKFILSDNAGSLRQLLQGEVDAAVDVLARQVFRRAVDEAIVALTPPAPPSIPLLGSIFPQPPKLDEITLPMILPSFDQDGRLAPRPRVSAMTLQEFKDIVAPRLTQDEEIYAIGLAEGCEEFLGKDIANLLRGENVLSPSSVQVVLNALRSGAFGRSDILSSDAAKSVLSFAETALSSLSSGSLSSRDNSLAEALDSLGASEKERFDEILQDIVQRSIKRSVERISQQHPARD